MLIICPHCKKQHNIDEKRIPPSVKMARCQGCGQQFPLAIARETPPEPTTAAAPPPPRPAGKEVRRIGVSLSKGGVGKTTTAVNLAAGLAMAGFRVLLVDTDTQGQSAFMLGLKPKAGLTELVAEELTAAEAVIPARKNLWLLAGGKGLAGLKRIIDRKDFGGEQTLADAITPLESAYDYVVVDTSPGWDPLTVNVLFYVNELLTPVSLEVMSLQGFGEFLKSIAAIQKYRPEVALKYILPTFRDKRVKQADDFLDQLKKMYGPMVCEPIRYNVRISEAPAYGQTIYEFAPGSNGAHDYRELIRKVADNPNLFT
ncbi:MAG TPA: AAA family ATPase [Desulfurivibrionaceae bacterium]|nr:AAA family ATPase [Desulfurivibrionaceae bacterium]